MATAQEIFNGGVAVITGAGSGIGEALAWHAVGLGMKVVLADISATRIEGLAAELIASGAEALPIVTDVSDPSALDRLAQETARIYGDVRLLINNAGIETLGLTWEIPAQMWEKTLNINIHGVIHGVRAFAPAMIASANPAYIANVASIGALGMMPVQTSYVLSKHAVLSFTEGLFLEMQLVNAPIQVSVIMPGPVATRIFKDSDKVADPMVLHHQRMMQNMLDQAGIMPDQAAQTIFNQLAAGQFWISTHPEMTAGLASDRAAYLTGSNRPELAEQTRALLTVDSAET